MAELIVRKAFHEPGYAAAEVGEVGEWNYLAPERKAELLADGSLEVYVPADPSPSPSLFRGGESEPEVVGFALAEGSGVVDSGKRPTGRSRKAEASEVNDGVA